MKFIRLSFCLTACAGVLFLFTGCPSHKPCPTCPSPPTDTTSHNFAWTTQTLGDGASSTLYDVEIISDTLAYAVGALYLKDSLGNWDPNAYNLAKWDGVRWNLLKLRFYTFCGQSATDSYPAKTILAFNAGEVFISDGAQFTSWDGQNQGPIMCLPVTVNKMWGIDKNNIYAVGNGGQIGYYNGNNWTKIESGTTLDIYDIYGSGNEIIAVAAHIGVSFDRKILRIAGTTVSSVNDSSITQSLESVWFVPGQNYYVVGDGLYEKNMLSESVWRNISTDIFTTIRGNSSHDIFAAGIGGRIMHFNGLTWMNYQNQTGLPGCIYGRVELRNNFVVAVGTNNGNAIVAMGRR